METEGTILLIANCTNTFFMTPPPPQLLQALGPPQTLNRKLVVQKQKLCQIHSRLSTLVAAISSVKMQQF